MFHQMVVFWNSQKLLKGLQVGGASVPQGGGVLEQPSTDQETAAISEPLPPFPPLEGITGSGNNINIQVQENTGNNVLGQSGDKSYPQESIFQGQSSHQDSNVVF
jgi:hypothetical protein